MADSLATILGAHRLIWTGEPMYWECSCTEYQDRTLWPGFNGEAWDMHLEAAVREQFALIPHSRIDVPRLAELLTGYEDYDVKDGWTFRTRDAARALIPYLLTGDHDV